MSVGVIILRRSRPDLPRAFRVPAVPLIPILAVGACLVLMLFLTVETWLRFLVWMALGFVVYFIYSYRNSRLAHGGAGLEMPEQQRDIVAGGGAAAPRE